ncbi:citrate/2-methylcitrate synthase [Aliikangiella sp. IMCC44632]
MSLQDLLQHEDKIVTRMGKAFLAERVVYRGKDLHTQCNKMSWLELFVYGITGREFTPPQLELLNFMWVSTSYPDKSIWPNQIAALAANSRSTPILGLSSGLSAFEATLYAAKPLKACIDFLYRAAIKQTEGISITQIVKDELASNKIIYGYGRPLASSDERVPHLIKFATDRDLAGGEHLKLALAIANILQQEKAQQINIVAVYAAIGADLGFTPQEFHLFMTPAAFAGMPPCYIEARENPPGSFLPIRCSRINYIGKKKRKWL